MSSGNDTFEDDLLEDRIKTNVWDPVLFRRMMRYVLPYWRRMAVGLVLVGLSAFFAVSPPALIGPLVDVVFHNESSLLVERIGGFVAWIVPGLTLADFMALEPAQRLWIFAVLFLIVRLGAFFADWVNGYVLAKLGFKTLHDIRMELFSHVHGLSLSYFHRNPVGRLVTRTTNDVDAMREMFSVALVTILKDLAMLAGIAAILLAIDVRLGLVALSITPFMALATVIFRKYSRASYRRWRAALSRLNAFLAESLSGVRVVKLFHKEARNDDAYQKIGGEYRQHFLDQRRAWAVFRPVSTTLSATGIALVLWFGGHMALGRELPSVDESAISVGLLVTFLSYAEMFFAPIRDLTEKFDMIQGAMTSAERIFTILDEKADVVDQPGAVAPTGRLKGEVEFEDVRFEYKPGEPVLRGVSFRIEPGRSAAIVGHTGAGKTTIVNLVSRFYDIQGGSVKVDGRDVREYTLKGLRQNVAIVHQDVFLFAGTILDNIRLGDESITLEQVKRACEYVGADRFIEGLEGGYQATVEEGGKTFSAGERQLLSFARALVFDPAILVLDEATSSIDTHTEELIQKALVKLTKGRTSIIIAHRLSTIQRADTILVMHKGRLAEQGTHQELLALRGLYHRLYQLQYSALEGVEKERPAVDGPSRGKRLVSSGALRAAAETAPGKARDAACAVDDENLPDGE